jgi:hypothetical protein
MVSIDTICTMQTKDPSHKALTGKIREATKSVQSGHVRLLNPESIAADLLELNCEISEVKEVLSDLLKEITPGHYAGGRPPQRSYEADLGGNELYAFKIESKRLGCLVYFKFVLLDGYLWLVSLHENKTEH